MFILTRGKPKGGTALTIKLTSAHKKPYLLIDLSSGEEDHSVLEWGRANHIKILNVAGPRESESPGIYIIRRFVF